MPTAASLPRADVADRRPDGSLHAIAAALLAFELLPLAFLLWGDSWTEPGRLFGALPIRATLLAALLVTAAAVALGMLAVDRRTGSWAWPGLVGLLLVPMVASALILLPLGAGGHLDARLWLLVFLGFVNGQMTAAACLRQAAAGIPANRLRAAALDCVSLGQRVRHVFLPACAPALGWLAALTFVGSWSVFLLVCALRWSPDDYFRSTLEAHTLAVYALASLPAIFLGLWTLRACFGSMSRPFARG